MTKKRHTTLKKPVMALAALMLLSATAFTFAACGDTSESSTPTTTTKTDNCAIANGNFEYYTDDATVKLINSVNSWSKSAGTDANGNSARSSSAESGIVDTETAKWNTLTTSKVDDDLTDDDEKKFVAIDTSASGDYIKAAMDEAEAKWDDMTAYDRVIFYKDLESAITTYNATDPDKKYSIYDFKYYTTHNYSIKKADIPTCGNPGTHRGFFEKSEDGEYFTKVDKDGNAVVGDDKHYTAEEAGTGVLMIHNAHADKSGTAQKYTSSTTVSLTAGTSAKISLWIKTADLKYDDGKAVDGNRGANISVTHTVGNKTLDQLRIVNIDTKDATENNGWVEYTVYVKACAYASSTFTVVVGLGDGSTSNQAGYVEGYAFVDDVDYTVISNAEYDAAVSATVPTADIYSTKQEKTFRADGANKNDFVYALDLYSDIDSFAIGTNVDVTYGPTSTLINNIPFTPDYTKIGVDTSKDLAGKYSLNDLKGVSGNEFLSKILEDDFKDDKYLDNVQDMIFLMSTNGAAYTAKMTAKDSATAEFTNGNLFTLDKDEYMLVSFWIKTSDTTGYTGATITLYDAATPKALGPYNTTQYMPVNTSTEKDIYSGWVPCFFFVQNTTKEEHSFSLEFSYGPTSNLTTLKKQNLHEGYAAFTGFSYCKMNSTEFSSFAGSTSFSTSVSLLGINGTPSSDGFAAATPTTSEVIKENLADPNGYTGVQAGDALLVGIDESKPNRGYGPTNQSNADNLTAATAKSVGVLNKKYFDAYHDNADASTDHSYDWFITLAGKSTMTEALTALTSWKDVFGTATQPLLISNVVEQSYGYFSASYALGASSYSAVSLRVMASAGAKAYVYLVNTKDLKSDEYGTTNHYVGNSVSYWYDADGNICLKDPTDKSFNFKTDVAFVKGDNGLFTNNLNKEDKNVYANLMNYNKDEDGNLVVKTSNSGTPIVSHQYTEDYVDDGIAFYAKDGAFYAYSDFTTEVKDLSTATVNGKNFTLEYARYISNDFITSLGKTKADLGENVTVTGEVDTTACIIVDGTDPNVAGKWVTVSFYVVTGNEQYNYRLEVFSGSKDGSVKNPAGSFVAFDSCSSSDLASNYDGLLKEAIEDMTDGNYRMPTVDFATGTKTYETVTDLVKNNKNGRIERANDTTFEGAEYYTYSFYDDSAYQRYDKTLDEIGTGNLYKSYDPTSNSETLTYLYYETDNTTKIGVADESVGYTMFVNYTALNKTVTGESVFTPDDDDEEETKNEWWKDGNFWAMLSSIVLAVVLVVALTASFVVKMVKSASKKSAGRSTNRYDAKRKQYMRRLNLVDESEAEEEAPTVVVPEAPTEEENPYED